MNQGELNPVSNKYTKFDAMCDRCIDFSGLGLLSYCALHSLGVPEDPAGYGSMGLALLGTILIGKFSKK
jgi:hypothetical protein